jgi:hypothetical protein
VEKAVKEMRDKESTGVMYLEMYWKWWEKMVSDY